jgi:hypothetical protein
MQNIKDTFYIALRDRLAALNPTRVVNIAGVVRPAVVVAENEVADAASSSPSSKPSSAIGPSAIGPQADTFYIHWLGVRELHDQGLVELDCEISYFVEGSPELAYQDRGRALAKSDDELLAITFSASTPLKDFSEATPVELGTNIFWTRPELGPIKVDGRRLARVAKLRVFSFIEVGVEVYA